VVDLAVLREQGVYRAAVCAEQLLADLTRLGSIDREAENRRRLLKPIFAIGLGAAFLGFPLAFFGAEALFNGEASGVLFCLPMLVGIPTALFAWRVERATARLDLPNYRYELLRKLIPVLQRDMAPDARFGVAVTFRSPVQPRTSVAHPRRANWRIKRFRDGWLDLSGRFLDGTRFRLRLAEDYCDITGRNVNNKERCKPRTKGLRLELRLGVAPRLASALDRTTTMQRRLAVRLPEGVELRTFKIEGSTLVLKAKLVRWVPARMTDQAGPDTPAPAPALPRLSTDGQAEAATAAITALLLSGFQMINACRLTADPPR